MPCFFVSECALVASLVMLVGCASREVPVRYPDGAPASPEAASAPPPRVTESLHSDPAQLVGPAGADAEAGGHGAHRPAPSAPRGHDNHEPATPEPARSGHEGHEGHHGHH